MIEGVTLLLIVIYLAVNKIRLFDIEERLRRLEAKPHSIDMNELIKETKQEVAIEKREAE